MAAESIEGSVKSKDKGETKASQKLIIFGDMHKFPEIYKVLTQSLGTLKANGYSTIYLESPSVGDSIEPADIDQLITNYNQKMI